MQSRRRVVLGATFAAALTIGAASTLAQAQPGPAPWAPGRGAGGMMGGAGLSFTPMMAGFGGGPVTPPAASLMGAWAPAGTTPLATLADARAAFQAYLDRSGTGSLALGDVMEFQNNYYAIVTEQGTGNGIFELLASKQTGAVFPEPGPNMMWNTRYGHMAGQGRPGMLGGWRGQPAPADAVGVTAERALSLAQQWLDRNQPGSTAETPDAFPGYYTLHTVQDGQITGMLSVNGSSGQVWYHGWHGAFVASDGMAR